MPTSKPDPFAYANSFDAFGQQAPLPSETSPFDPVARRERDFAITVQTSPDPEQVAKVSQAARKVGVAPGLIEDQVDLALRGINIRDMTAVMRQFPVFGKFFGENPRAAVMAQDDSKSLRGIMQSIAGPKQVSANWNAFRGGLNKVPQELVGVGGPTALGWLNDTAWSISDGIEGVNSLVTTPLNMALDPLYRAWGIDTQANDKWLAKRRAAQKTTSRAILKDMAEGNRPTYSNATEEAVLRGLDSTVASLMALATRNPNAAAAAFGVGAGASSYQDMKAEGRNTPDAIRYALQQGIPEAVFERAPASALLEALVKRLPTGKTFASFMAEELPGEMATTFVQSYSDWQMKNPTMGADEWVATLPGDMQQTVLGVLGGGTAQVVLAKTAERSLGVAGKVVGRVADAQAAKADAARMDGIAKNVEASNLRTRDPETFREAMKAVLDDAGAEHVYLPGEAAVAYFQSDAYDPDNDPMAEFYHEAFDAAASGGDVVLPADFALSVLPGTPAWEAVLGDLRLSSGGMSANEADSLDIDAMMAEVGERFDKIEAAQREANDARATLTEKIAAKLNNAGYTPYMARAQAEYIAQRSATRAARLGKTLTGDEFDAVEVNQVLPPELARAKAADGTDLVINALRKGKDAEVYDGPSLLEWIAKRGGINDTGGDLKSMGLDKWHRGKVGRKKLLRKFDPAQGAFGGVSGAGDYGVDSTLRAAIEAGYFPELVGVEGESGPSSLDTQVLLDALADENAGRPRYAGEPRVDNMRAAAEELRGLLADRGLDPDGMTDAELRAVIAQLDAASAGGFEQALAREEAAFEAWAGVPRDQVISSIEALSHEFKTGETIAVEAFHGTARPDRVGGQFRADRATAGPMAYFTSDPELASSYAAGKADTSIDADDLNYENWFKLRKGDGETVSIAKVWDSLSATDRVNIRKLAPRVQMDDETGEKIELGPESNTRGNGGYQLRGRMNPLEGLIEAWLTSGALYDQESRFLEVLKLAGVSTKEIIFEDPHASHPSVYPVFISMRSPLVSRDIPDNVVAALKDAAKANPEPSADRYRMGWDKNDISLADWVDDFLNGEMSEYVWTRIPDAVTDVFRSLGYDGLVDWSGKGIAPNGSSERAPVYIPFAESQVKSQFNRGTFDPADARILYQPAYHGSPHIFDKFSLSAIGTGEGAQAYGWGLYFAGRKEIAEHYRKVLSDHSKKNQARVDAWKRYDDALERFKRAEKMERSPFQQSEWDSFERAQNEAHLEDLRVKAEYYGARPTDGRLYQVEIPEDDEYLLWDRPLSEQPGRAWDNVIDAVKSSMTDHGEELGAMFELGDVTGEEAYRWIAATFEKGFVPDGLPRGMGLSHGKSAQMASEILHEAGIAGIKYLDGTSRSDGEGSYNYVVFDENRVSIQAYEQSAEAVAEARALFDRLMDDLGDGKNVADAFEQMKVLSNIREEWVKKLGQEPGGIELKSRSGLRAAITRSQENSTGWRVTWFDDRGFSGHVETKTKEEAARIAIFEGYDIPAPGALREAMASGTFFQRALNDGPRGRIQFNTGRTVIDLFQARNNSTLIHELSHMWLEELRIDAETPGAPDQLKQDWQTVQDWFAANNQPVTDGIIPVEAHELFARAGERYVMEGKAPSPALTRLFETFRGWMVSVYKTVTALRAPITPEIRSVFDRLVATDEELNAMAERQALEPLFKDAASIGMSEQEFAAYSSEVDNARTNAASGLLTKTMAIVKARVTKEMNEQRRTLEAEASDALDQTPLYRALRALKSSPVNAQWIRDEMGADALDLLPRRVPPVYSDKGAHPDAIAEMAGYGSGRDMIDDLIGAEIQHRQAKEGGDQRTMRERTIAQNVDEEMRRRHGDPFSDGSIEREALEAVHNDKQGEVFAAEARALARKTGQRVTPYKVAREWARRRVREGTYAAEASPAAIQRHARNAAKAGTAAEKAMLAGKFDEALLAKQQQMIASAQLSEAKQANDEVEAARKRMDKIARRATSKSVDQDYLDQAHALLEAVDLRERSQKLLNRAGSWEEWSNARAAEGFDIVVPPSFEALIGKTNWSRLPVEQLLGLDAAVAQVMHLGRLKQTLLDNQERRDFEELVQEARAGAGNIDGPPPQDLMEPGWFDAIKAKVAATDAALLKMETIFDWLDGGNSNGVFNRIAFRPIANAQGREQDMLKDYYGRIKALFEAVPGEITQRWGDTVTLPFTNRDTGRPERVRRQQLLAIALNTGNEGNLQRLTDGYGWNADALMEVLNAELTADEWVMVQGVWDVIETLWPEIEGMEKRVNGLAPEKVEAREIVTPFGTFRGGYYPAIYDSTRNYRAEENRGKESDLFEGGYTRATTRASATKNRLDKVTAPILLDLGVINRHLGEVIHDVTHREAVMQANKFLTNERIMRVVDEALGPEIRKQFRPWVKFVANSWAIERAGNEGFGKWLGKLRANVTAVGMGLRATTMITQIAGYSNSVEVVGEKWVAEAIARTTAHPVDSFRFVLDKSAEVRGRMDTLDRDIRTEMARLSAANPASKAARAVLDGRKFFFHGIGYMDRVVVVPTWIAAYNKAQSEGMAEQDAIYAADKAVRVSQGSGAPKDMAAITRGTGKWGEALKLMTMFYSYFSAMYQRERTLGRDVAGNDQRRPRNVPRLAARAFWLLAVPPLLTEVLKAGLGGGDAPDDEEWWAQWVLRKMLANSIGPIPMARDVFEPAWNAARGGQAFTPAFSPVNRALSSFVDAARDVGKIARGDETTKATKHILETTGYATGLIPGQVASAAQFMVDVGAGDADPEGFADWVQGLSTGKIKDD